MLLSNKTVVVGSNWTLVTSLVGSLQFNDDMEVIINQGDTPMELAGFEVIAGTEYTNGADGLYVWAKSKLGGTGVESIRVMEVIG